MHACVNLSFKDKGELWEGLHVDAAVIVDRLDVQMTNAMQSHYKQL